MTIPQHNFTWQQGEDAVISLTYKDDSGNPIDLTGYSVRMEVAAPGSNSGYTFNTDDSDPETVDEIVEPGSDGVILITIPRSVTLPTPTPGALVGHVGSVVEYDVFLRNVSGKQKKILRGTISIEASKTLWA